MDDMGEKKISKIDLLVSELEAEMKTSGVDPRIGLPESLFLFVSSVTPLINVDLLVRVKDKGLLFAWRDEKYNGRGWHIPGGIVRLHERIEDRVHKTALNEIGCDVAFERKPLMVQEDILGIKRPWLKNELERSHNISMLFECKLPRGFDIAEQGEAVFPGYLKWFDHMPEDFLECHRRLYGDTIANIYKGDFQNESKI